MTYSKINFKDRNVQYSRRYTMKVDGGSTSVVTLEDNFGTVTTLGTPLDAANMDHIEEGILGCATTDLDNLSTQGQSVLNAKLDVTSAYYPNILEYKWTDHVLNDEKWLLANNFSWHYRTAYPLAYDTLVAEADSTIDKTVFEGGATISDTGIASGFTTALFISPKVPVTLNYYDSWSVKGQFTTGAASDTAQEVLQFDNPLAAYISITNKNLVASTAGPDPSNPTTTKSILVAGATVQPSTSYYYELTFTGTSYAFYLGTSAGNMSLIKSVASTTKVISTNKAYVGRTYNGFSPFKGTMDLKAFSITANNRTLVSGSVTETDYYNETWSCPKFTSNTSNGTVSASSEYGTNYQAYKALDGTHSTTNTNSWFSIDATTSGWWKVVFPYKIRVFGLTYYSPYNAKYCSKDMRFYADSNKRVAIGDAFVGSATANVATIVAGIPTEGVITDTIYLDITSTNSTAANAGIGMGELIINAEKVLIDPIVCSASSNGFRIVSADYESLVESVFTRNKMAWYYILDKTNQRFKLARTSNTEMHGQVVEENISGANGIRIFEDGYCEQWGTLPFSATDGWTKGDVTFMRPFRDTNYCLLGRGNWSDAGSCDFRVNSMSTTGFNVTVAINMLTDHNGQWSACGYLPEGQYFNNVSKQYNSYKRYLYFYVGNFSQTASEQMASLNAEAFNNKQDIQYCAQKVGTVTTNVAAPYLKATYVDGVKGYRIWSDGYCEQWGMYDKGAFSTKFSTTIKLHKVFADVNYNISVTVRGMKDDHYGAYGNNIESVTTESFAIYYYTGGENDGSRYLYWRTCGYLAAGQY